MKTQLAKDLFDMFAVSAPLMDSPKITWLLKHGLTTAHDAGWEDPATCWSCYPTNLVGDVTKHNAGLGDTEDVAILDFCAKTGVRHWTLEPESAP